MTKNTQVMAKMAGLATVAVLSSFLGANQAQATTLVSNLGESNDGVDPIITTHWGGSNFTTGIDSYQLTGVSLPLVAVTSSANFFVSLYSNNAGQPGSALTSFTPTTTIGSPATYAFTPNSSVTLAANTTYWLVAGISSGVGEYDWSYTTSFNQTSSAGWTIGDGYAYTGDGGASWTLLPTAGPYFFSVDGAIAPAATTPEPSFLVGLLGLGALGLVSRRKSWK